MKITSVILCAGLALTVAFAGEDTSAGKQTKPDPKPTAKQVAPRAQAVGMVVAKDPDGALRAPTAAEALALQGPQRDSAAPVQIVTANGVMVVLDPASSNVYSVMTKGPDGKLRMECVTGEKAAESVMRRGMLAVKPAHTEAASEK